MSQPSSEQPIRPEVPGPGVPDDPFVRFNARVLDPTTAGKLPDGSAASITAYVSNRLMVTAENREAAEALLTAIDEVLPGSSLRRQGRPEQRNEGDDGWVPFDPFELIEGDGEDVRANNELAELLQLALETGTPVSFPVVLESEAEADLPPAPEDVWPLLRRLRHRGTNSNAQGVIGLDHLMFGAATILGNPVNPRATALVAGNPVNPRATSEATTSYSEPGFGGHGPVAVVIGAPAAASCEWTPHVVVLDTGVGQHDWFTAPNAPVQNSMTLSNGRHIGLNAAAHAATDPEAAGSVPDPMTGLLGSHAGHGTFIAGLLRQQCPEARISALRIMDADGVVPEWDLARSIMTLGIKVAQEPESVDALVLSLGYYAEDGDREYNAGLKMQLLTLARRGIVTFAAAGNDCTQRPSYPAGFAKDPEFNPSDAEFEETPTLPLVAVAALNPDRRTIALFSNDGSWVNGEAVGANLVSTAPKFAQGSYQAAVSVQLPNGRSRSTLDPDDYSSGFATWSGTSFAAPVLAAQYLGRLVGNENPDVSTRRKLVPLRQS